MPIQQSTITLTRTAFVLYCIHSRRTRIWHKSSLRTTIMGGINIFFLGQMIWDRHVYIVNKVSFLLVCICLRSDKPRFACVLACVHQNVCGMPTWQKREGQFTIKLMSISVKSGHCNVWIWDHTICAV